MNKRYNSIIHGYTKSAPKRVKAKQAKQLARQTSLPLGGRSARAALDASSYEAGIKVRDEELAAVRIRQDKFHGDWNYNFSPMNRPDYFCPVPK